MKAINSGIRNASRPENLKGIGDKLVHDIQDRTRQGKEVKDVRAARTSIKFEGGSVVKGRTTGATIPTGKFKALKKQTVNRRKRSTLHPDTTPEKSNQTLTGKMVDSLKHKTTRGQITLSVDKDQEKKLRGNIGLGRNFLRLSKNNLKTIAVDVVSYIVKAIERDIK